MRGDRPAVRARGVCVVEGSSLMDRITITGIEVFAYHGVIPAEQEQGQRFLIDLDLAVGLARAGATDDLHDTVDYGLLAQQVHDLVVRDRWNLIERVAERVADLVLGTIAVAEVTVTVHKPEAPMAVPFADVAVTITRLRE